VKALPTSKRRCPADQGTSAVEMSPALEMAKETPLVVRCLAQAMYASSCLNGADPQLLQILNRTTSERMKKVWSELLKRKRVDYSPTNDFVHAVSAPGPHTSWTPQARSWRRRADELRELGGSHLSRSTPHLPRRRRSSYCLSDWGIRIFHLRNWRWHVSSTNWSISP
jgi:hypothetical protein